MALSRAETCKRIVEMSFDDYDVEVTADQGGFLLKPVKSGPYVSDIGSSYEVPDNIGEHGRERFTAGPFDAYQYHASYTTPRPDNYEPVLDDLAAGDISKAVFGYGALEDTWVFGVRVFD